MKQWIALVVLGVLCLSLTGCKANYQVVNENPQVEQGETAVVTPETLEYQGKTYQYTVQNMDNGYTIVLTYDDGAQFSWSWMDGKSIGGSYYKVETTDVQRQAAGYLRGFEATKLIHGAIAVTVKKPVEIGTHFWSGLLLLVGGAFYAVFPKKAYAITTGWKYKNLEPTDGHITMLSMSGVVAILVGVALIL